MDPSRAQQIDTGVDDRTYDLVLVMQQALEDCHRYQCFAHDARAAGDDEVADWFDELAASDREIAQKAKSFLDDRWTA
ncbi:MAG: hypothetical protein ACTHN0_08395 [Aquihabitans sp.]